MNKEVITNEIIVVLEDLGIDPELLSPNAAFINDLGLDSLDFVELILKLEIFFDIVISFDYTTNHTIDDLVKTIAQKME